ncbi:MAG TPA: methyltransferase domain-containing protein [Acidimicrobiales bacterium]|nr:methyltransferase domain-containing protein [Acidimicrobiales bacterium]
MNISELRDEVDKYPWYHTIDLGNGILTKGMFDHRAYEGHYMLPDDLSGRRCLDVATMDGYWAFAMERRGATEVVALDIEDPEALDWPASIYERTVKTIDETKGTRFELARTALGSRVQRELRSAYALDTDLGTFDFIFCGDLLVHLKDPMTAIERIRRVCRGSAVICNPVKEQFPYRRRPLAQFDGINEFEWWVTNLAGLERMVRAAGFERVEVGKPFDVPATGGGSWRGRRGVVRGSV